MLPGIAVKMSGSSLRILAIAGLGACALARLSGQNLTPPTPAAPPAPAVVVATLTGNQTTPPPAVIPELRVGDKIYYDVRVRQVTPRDIIFLHRDGLSSAALADLPPEWQQRFGYDPAKAAADAARLDAATQTQRAQGAYAPPPAGAPVPVRLADHILQQFGQPAQVFELVNMRPRFTALGIAAENQGARPSCAVFAIVTALEFQQAPAGGPAPQLSEEYLIWATLKTLGKAGVRLPKTDTPGFDVGFALPEVVQALRAYGIALQSELPYQLSAANPTIEEPPPDVIDRAKLRSPVNGYVITGREPAMEINGIVQTLNEGVPVIAGVKWPDEKVLQQTATLDDQPGRADADHAVVLVGYHSSTGKIEDTIFLFKNSYGEKWGDHGYGTFTYHYLIENLETAFFMDVQ